MKKFQIKKGKHYPKGFNFSLFFSNELNFVCKFDKNCIYDLKSNDNFDINKLFGFSTTIHQHIQSARIGWRCIDNKNIELLLYVYNESNRILEKTNHILGTVKPDEKFYCSIIKQNKTFVFKFFKGNKTVKSVEIPRSKTYFPLKYILYPYFGGNRKAPHDMDIYIDYC